MASVTLRAKAIDKKGFSLYLDIYNEGNRYKEYLKLYVSKDYTKPENKNILKQDKDSWELADAIRSKRLLIVKESAAGFIPKQNKQDFITYYKKQATIKAHSSYNNALQYLIAFINKDTLPFKQLDEHLLKDFISYLQQQKKLSTTSVRLYLSRMNIILNLAVADKIIVANPFNFLKRGKGGDIPAKKQKKIEYLTLDELRRFQAVDIKRSDIKDFFLFSCFTGLRESDLLKLKWSDILDGTLTYSQKKQRDSITYYMPLSKQAILQLESIKAFQSGTRYRDSEYVFAHLGSKRNVLVCLKKIAAKAGIDKNVHIHVGRHTFATMSLTHGVSLYTVSKLLGHSSIAVTQFYAEIVDEIKQKASELLPML